MSFMTRKLFEMGHNLEAILSNTTVKLTSWRTFLNINSGAQTLPISAHEMAPMRAFSVLQKWPKIAKMTPNDLGYPWPMKYGPFIILKSANFMQTAGVETIAYSY